MIAEIFNSSLISGPETLVLPNLKHLKRRSCVIFLREERCSTESNRRVHDYFSRYADVHTIAVHRRNDASAARELRKTLERLDVRFAHAHDVKASFLLNAAGPSSRYLRLSTHHGVNARSGTRVHLYEQLYTRLLLPRFDRALVVCSSDQASLVKRGVPAARVRVHLNGVDRTLVAWPERKARRAEIQRAWGIEAAPGEKILGVVARLAKEKDHALMLRVVRRLANGPFRVLCFGSGPLAESLAQQTRRLGLENKVLWMGYRPEMSAELPGLDGLLSFSRAEGLPINLIEAGFAATPLFARRVDGVADLVPSAEFGDTFSPGLPESEVASRLNAFISRDLETDASIALRMQARVSERFSGRAWAQRLDEILGEI